MPNLHKFLLAVFFIVMIWSLIDAADYPTWVMEASPAVLAVVILSITYKKFRFTNIAYTLILIHCVILFVGAKYTYAEVPLFHWIQELFHQSRNNYDKLGHFAQGFIPAIVVREVLVRRHVVSTKAWTNFIVICICLAISAAYELIEWLAAEMMGQSADAFLGTQGYVWDTQSDMLCALIGACCMIIFLSKLHDSCIQELNPAQMHDGLP